MTVKGVNMDVVSAVVFSGNVEVTVSDATATDRSVHTHDGSYLADEQQESFPPFPPHKPFHNEVKTDSTVPANRTG